MQLNKTSLNKFKSLNKNSLFLRTNIFFLNVNVNIHSGE